MQPASLLFKRYLWLVDLIYRSGGITREEINYKWRISSLNSYGESEIPESTFHRHKEAIKELFDIEITCVSRNGQKVYEISNSDSLEKEGITSWLLNGFAINQILKESRDFKNRIIFEEIPSGQKYLTPLIKAMKDGKTVVLTHQKFNQDPYDVEVEPYCLKVFHQRWYLLCRRVSDKKIRVYSLDRINRAEETGTTFTMLKDFDPDNYFSECMGIIIGAEKAEYIEIKVTGGQQHYISSLPIHHSQKEIDTTDDYTVFSFYIRPTFDFIQELLKYGECVEVLKPEWLRGKFLNIAKEMISLYEK